MDNSVNQIQIILKHNYTKVFKGEKLQPMKKTYNKLMKYLTI